MDTPFGKALVTPGPATATRSTADVVDAAAGRATRTPESAARQAAARRVPIRLQGSSEEGIQGGPGHEWGRPPTKGSPSRRPMPALLSGREGSRNRSGHGCLRILEHAGKVGM